MVMELDIVTEYFIPYVFSLPMAPWNSSLLRGWGNWQILLGGNLFKYQLQLPCFAEFEFAIEKTVCCPKKVLLAKPSSQTFMGHAFSCVNYSPPLDSITLTQSHLGSFIRIQSNLLFALLLPQVTNLN